ncbi:DUF3376 domain-containing protein [Cupriavidus sp. TMH.W2]|uniref:DUF3376 domain-containing protein n=1 Tax=Cupriavidus sp. TMH.W2 TaxID=3434465 RepID=UPI003D78014F
MLFAIREEFRVAILTAYLGYFYRDILLRPVANILSLDAGPIEEIVVDRISPEDTTIISSPTGNNPLLGASLGGFGGFLGRPARENDYLWGRLHGVDRLFDILFDTTPAPLRDRLDITALKKRAFQCVLDEEAAQLKCIPELLRELADAIASI